MKKVLYSLIGLMLCGFYTEAQVSGTISGFVVDAVQQPVPGIAVFYYGGGASANADAEKFIERTYTDASGNYSINYSGLSQGDSIRIGVMDCQGYLHVSWTPVGSSIPNNIQIPCVPGPCDAITYVEDSTANPSQYVFHAISLIDSAFANPAGGFQVTHNWSATGFPILSNNYYTGPNYDTTVIGKFQMPSDFSYCYQRNTSCNPVCDSTTSPFCKARFYVDTLNSINFQGQIVVWENSSTSAGNIVNYQWDFGDGTTYNAQYPTHSYNDTGVYQVCLTVTAVDGSDTCVSTHCDSIGLDNNGNVVYKGGQQGFTINVVDPSTVGIAEDDLRSAMSLYPNPSAGNATLEWGNGLNVNRIEIISVSGQVVQSIEPQGDNTKVKGLRKGAYLLRVSSDEGVTSLKMIVE